MHPNHTNFKRRAAQTAALVLIAAMLGTGNAQQAPALSKHATGVKKATEALAPNAPISVIKLQGNEEYGKFQSSNDAGFTFYDVDLNKDVTLNYEEVRKIKNGYGGVNSFHHAHTDHTKAIIITVAVLAALGGLIAAVASARN